MTLFHICVTQNGFGAEKMLEKNSNKRLSNELCSNKIDSNQLLMGEIFRNFFVKIVMIEI